MATTRTTLLVILAIYLILAAGFAGYLVTDLTSDTKVTSDVSLKVGNQPSVKRRSSVRISGPLQAGATSTTQDPLAGIVVAGADDIAAAKARRAAVAAEKAAAEEKKAKKKAKTLKADAHAKREDKNAAAKAAEEATRRADAAKKALATANARAATLALVSEAGASASVATPAATAAASTAAPGTTASSTAAPSTTTPGEPANAAAGNTTAVDSGSGDNALVTLVAAVLLVGLGLVVLLLRVVATEADAEKPDPKPTPPEPKAGSLTEDVNAAIDAAVAAKEAAALTQQDPPDGLTDLYAEKAVANAREAGRSADRVAVRLRAAGTPGTTVAAIETAARRAREAQLAGGANRAAEDAENAARLGIDAAKKAADAALSRPPAPSAAHAGTGTEHP